MAKTVFISDRKEDVREKNDVPSILVQFELEQIKKHFSDSLDDIKKQFAIADGLVNQGKTSEAEDVWRSQIVFLEGILDFYVHELSKYALVKIFNGKWPKSQTYMDFQIPMITVEEGLKNPESSLWLLERLNIRFASETYLHPKQLGKQLSLIGMKLDDICKKAFPPKKGQVNITGQDRLESLFNRRNQIVHQVDRKNDNAKKNIITKSFVDESMDSIVKFVDALHSEALALDS